MKIKIKNISGTNQRLLFRPNSPNANVNIIDTTYNPTLGLEESGSFYFCLGTSEDLPPIDYPFTCEGATPEMYLEQELDDRSRWRLTVNNTVLEVTSQDNDIEAGSIPVLFNHYHEATLSQLGLSLFSSDRILFTNHSNTEMKIRLAPLNIYGVVGIATDNVNRTGGYNSYDRSVEFCLAPNINQAPPEGQFDGEAIETTSGWALITFDELGTTNPSYTIQHSTLGTVVVTTGSAFIGQTVTQNGRVHTITGKPSLNNNLRLDGSQWFTAKIKKDGSNPDSPVLSGSVGFDSPISVLFSVDVHAVGLTGGYFDNIGSTYIEVYDRVGNVLGRATNTQVGIETFGFSIGNQAKIAGFSFYVNNYESAGFALDNLRFK